MLQIISKDKFYEEHRAELSLYDTALRTLKEKSDGNKLPSMTALYAEKNGLLNCEICNGKIFLTTGIMNGSFALYLLILI